MRRLSPRACDGGALSDTGAVAGQLILPFFGPGLPNPRTGLTPDQMITTRGAGPKGREVTANDSVFLMLFEG
ncbi:MAG: hypothetical protein EBZ36_08340 [Acidobacteria bacterium]|nr:hypothetical protein [Acidobacteriota bacterium]